MCIRDRLDAVRQGEVERACRLLEAHIEEAGEILVRGLAIWRMTVVGEP